MPENYWGEFKVGKPPSIFSLEYGDLPIVQRYHRHHSEEENTLTVRFINNIKLVGNYLWNILLLFYWKFAKFKIPLYAIFFLILHFFPAEIQAIIHTRMRRNFTQVPVSQVSHWLVRNYWRGTCKNEFPTSLTAQKRQISYRTKIWFEFLK